MFTGLFLCAAGAFIKLCTKPCDDICSWTAGIFLYTADVVVRLVQQANVTTVTEWRVIGKGNNKTLVITLPVDQVS